MKIKHLKTPQQLKEASENLNISDVIMSRKCKKSLYKSTYKGNAFTKGKTYNVVEEDDDFFYFTDDAGRLFNFSKLEKLPYYWIDDYFYSL